MSTRIRKRHVAIAAVVLLAAVMPEKALLLWQVFTGTIAT